MISLATHNGAINTKQRIRGFLKNEMCYINLRLTFIYFTQHSNAEHCLPLSHHYSLRLLNW